MLYLSSQKPLDFFLERMMGLNADLPEEYALEDDQIAFAAGVAANLRPLPWRITKNIVVNHRADLLDPKLHSLLDSPRHLHQLGSLTLGHCGMFGCIRVENQIRNTFARTYDTLGAQMLSQASAYSVGPRAHLLESVGQDYTRIRSLISLVSICISAEFAPSPPS